jgi:putative tricarboxylic transport membrane protein
VFDLWVMLGFGVVGYFLRKFDYPLAPMVIGAVLGPICEANFRRSLVISGNDYGIFVERPLAATILAINLALLIWVAMPAAFKQRAKAGMAQMLGARS